MRYIQIAGTNGKGSTAQYLAGILGKTGKCGLFTSPHIFSPLERFRIDGAKISQSLYDSYMAEEKRDPAEHYFGPWTRVPAGG
jgi:dihydrofolate synthase/folylpolyglutamate synthase